MTKLLQCWPKIVIRNADTIKDVGGMMVGAMLVMMANLG